MRHADSLQQLESWLEPTEVLALLSQPDCLEQLNQAFHCWVNEPSSDNGQEQIAIDGTNHVLV